jgi:predicted SprT family Zn-dependent metalloprotease
MRIPKRFQLFGHTIEVNWYDNLLIRTNNVGEAHYNFNEIKLDYMHERPESYKEQVFLHEVLHLILNLLGEEELRQNEKLVDTFASLLHQAINTMEYDD